MKRNWVRLDNAAKIFASGVHRSNTQVFRFSCALKEAVDPDCLQQALQKTAAAFPVFSVILKRGLFWYFLESTDLAPEVQQEYKPPCAALWHRDKDGLLYEVTYYQNRIHLETFHVLADGTGSSRFFTVLITHYLALRRGISPPSTGLDASFTQMSDDSFRRHYSIRRDGPRQKDRLACQITGRRLPENRIRVIRGLMPVSAVLQAARAHHTTMTGFLSACLMTSINEELSVRARRRPMVLLIPVNLRNYFDSESARNFFSIISSTYDFSTRPGTLEDVAAAVTGDLHAHLTLEHLTTRLNRLFSLERNVLARIAPLWFKDITLWLACRFTDLLSTATLSNLGRVELPEELQDDVEAFDVYISTSKQQVCVCSYRDTLSVGFTSPFVSTDIQKRFFRKLTALGIPVEIAATQEEAR